MEKFFRTVQMYSQDVYTLLEKVFRIVQRYPLAFSGIIPVMMYNRQICSKTDH
jgi:hypothetical protein